MPTTISQITHDADFVRRVQAQTHEHWVTSVKPKLCDFLTATPSQSHPSYAPHQY